MQVEYADVENPIGVLNPVSDTTAATASVSGSYNPLIRAGLGFQKSLLAFYELDSTTTIPASGTVPIQYIHKFIPTKTPNTLTVHEYIGDKYAFVSGGMHGESLSWTATRGETAILRAAMGLRGMWHRVYPNAETSAQKIALGLDGIITDAGNFVGGDLEMLYAGVKDCSISSWTFNRQNALTPDYTGCDASKAPSGYIFGDGPAQASAVARFSDLKWVKQFFGVGDTQALPFAFKAAPLKSALTLRLKKSNSDGTLSSVSVVLPNVTVTASNLTGEGGTPLDWSLSFRPLQSSAEAGRDHYILVQTIVPDATLAATSNLLTEVPSQVDGVDSYSVVPGVLNAAPVGSTVVINTNALLSPVANYYAQRTLVFATGALKDTEYTIVSSTAAGATGTVTLTLSSAVTAGALTGDEVGIIGGWMPS
jgi:hypothetical protein